MRGLVIIGALAALTYGSSARADWAATFYDEMGRPNFLQNYDTHEACSEALDAFTSQAHDAFLTNANLAADHKNQPDQPEFSDKAEKYYDIWKNLLRTHPALKDKTVKMLSGCTAIVLVACVVSGCAPVQVPVVDMTGIDQGKFSKDTAACYHDMPLVAAGNPLDSCLRDKGYKILVSR